MEPHKQQEPQWQTELGLPSDSDGQDYDNEDSVALRKLLKQQELKWMTALGISSRAELTKLACERQRLNTLWFALTTEDRLKLFREANGTGQDPVAIPKNPAPESSDSSNKRVKKRH